MPTPKRHEPRRTAIRLALAVGAVMAAWSSAGRLSGQEAWWEGGKFNCQRTVQLPPAKAQPRVVVTEFFTHGELRADGTNLGVCDSHNKFVPWRVLQVGPGDLCRVAFETVRGQKVYKVYYGGAASKSPPWTGSAGLLLETRRWKPCDLSSADSVREALSGAEVIGSDLVPGVFHRLNPLAPEPEPFLSRYRGTLRVGKPGKYQFFTSSQDCSFLFLDGRQVVAAQGTHGPAWDARIKGEVTLTAGAHEFEYLHAASGAEACMMAGWQPPGAGKVEAIPPEAFGSDEVAYLPATAPRHRTRGSLPDYVLEVVCEVPLPGSRSPLVRVNFRDISGTGVTGGAKVRWDFGDGQMSDQPEPVHIYLHPGLYTIKLSAVRGFKTLEVANRVQVHRAVVLAGAQPSLPLRAGGKGGGLDQLKDYLPMLEKYDPTRLDPEAVLQLVRAFDHAGRAATAAQVGKAVLFSEKPLTDERVAHSLAAIVGPLLLDHLDDPAAALAVWQAAARASRRPGLQAACEVEAADISLNDLMQRALARGLLDQAAAHADRKASPDLLSRLHRVWGDWHARGGDGKAAREAYARAQEVRESRRTTAEENAWRGAFSRSAEAFLRDGELARALDELRHWQDEFPADKVEGYLPLLQARYYVAREKLRQAAAVAGDAVAVNPDSPYADQLVYLAAGCEEKLGRADRARAGYQSLVTDYPGSPLVKEAREKLAVPATPKPEAKQPPRRK